MNPIDTDENHSAPVSKSSQRKMITIVITVAIALVALVALNMK